MFLRNIGFFSISEKIIYTIHDILKRINRQKFSRKIFYKKSNLGRRVISLASVKTSVKTV